MKCRLLSLATLLLSNPLNADELTAATLMSLNEQNIERSIVFYRKFLSLPNDANYPADIEQLVLWLESEFSSLGFETQRIDTESNPSLFVERKQENADRTVLIYLQADGQPVDPSAWQQDNPFEPVLKNKDADGDWQIIGWESLEDELNPDWRIFARSASDSKGPMAQFMNAVRILDDNDISLGFNLKVIIDTEEELGSPHLSAAVDKRRELMAADMLIIFDGPPHASNKPTVSFGARGITTLTLTAYGPLTPQHSGHYGNFIPNPAFHLSRILASMKSTDGRILIDGFYDGVEISEQVRQQLDAVPDDEAAILNSMGLAMADRVAPTLRESLQYPSLNIRGMRAAWVGSEARTIIPESATAEIDIRLVLESDDNYLIQLVRDHVRELGYEVLDQSPSDEERQEYPRIVSMTSNTSYGAFRSDFDDPPGKLARAAMQSLYGEEPILIRTMGGSIPIAPLINILGIPAATVATVNIDNNQHSPNENLRLGNFIEGISIIMAVLTQTPE